MRKEHPILCSTPVVESILDLRKSQTRRTAGLKRINQNSLGWDYMGMGRAKDGNSASAIFQSNDTLSCRIDVKCPYGNIGDILWVRESWQHTSHAINLSPDDENSGYIYRASQNGRDWESNMDDWKWKPSIHMPKEACRIYLEIEDIRIEPLQDITEADAVKEGIQCYIEGGRMRYKDYLADASGYGDPRVDYPTVGLAVTSFATLFKSINGPEAWGANHWVWVIQFKTLSTTGRPSM